MIARVGFGYPREFARALPVELTAFYDNSAYRGAVTADELGCGMNYDIRAVLDGSDKIRRCERRINDERDVVLMSNLGDSFKVDNIRIGIAESFYEYCFRILLYCIFECSVLLGIDKRCGDSRREGERVG